MVRTTPSAHRWLGGTEKTYRTTGEETGMTMFRELFEPMTVGLMQVVNRIMMSAMSAGMMLDKDGQITPEMIAYFIERVRNNPGMAAVGACAVVPTPEQWKYPVPIYSHHVIPSLKRFVDPVHQHDTNFGIQLWDAGSTEGGKRVLMSPSGLSSNARAKGAPTLGPQGNRALELD